VRHTALWGYAEVEDAARERFATVLAAPRMLYVVGSGLTVLGAAVRSVVDPRGGDDRPWTEFIRTGNHEGSSQPVFDLDGFISLAGRSASGAYTLLVGDPRMAAELTGAAVPDHALVDVFDAVAARLAERGFAVVRNPLPLVKHDDAVLRTRWWYFASSNNVLVEIDGDARTVWLPTYGDADHPELRLTDQSNQRIWASLGFEVRPLPSFHVFARGLGAAHCICKCLSR
jgi:hypothetical protein